MATENGENDQANDELRTEYHDLQKIMYEKYVPLLLSDINPQRISVTPIVALPNRT